MVMAENGIRNPFQVPPIGLPRGWHPVWVVQTLPLCTPTTLNPTTLKPSKMPMTIKYSIPSQYASDHFIALDVLDTVVLQTFPWAHAQA